MAAITGTLGSVAASSIGNSLADGETIFSVTGVFVGTWALERAHSNDPNGGWVTAQGPFTAPYSGTYSSRVGQLYRIRCTAYTSGTLTYSFTPAAVSGLLPTDPAGLPSGARWNNGGVICVA